MNLDWLNENTWIISDTHFRHQNIIKYCKRPEDHDRIMLENWNEIVGTRDRILHLGDLTLMNFAKAQDSEIPKLNGIKYLLIGNHDRLNTKQYHELGFNVLDKEKTHLGTYQGENNRLRFKGFYWKNILFSHYPAPVEWEKGFRLNIHGHIHNWNNHSVWRDKKGRNMRNVSVEMLDYKPIRLGALL